MYLRNISIFLKNSKQSCIGFFNNSHIDAEWAFSPAVNVKPNWHFVEALFIPDKPSTPIPMPSRRYLSHEDNLSPAAEISYPEDHALALKTTRVHLQSPNSSNIRFSSWRQKIELFFERKSSTWLEGFRTKVKVAEKRCNSTLFSYHQIKQLVQLGVNRYFGVRPFY